MSNSWAQVGSSGPHLRGMAAISVLLFLFQIIFVDGGKTGVQMKMNVKQPWLDLSCEVNGNPRTIYLYCPHVKAKVPRPCFQECEPTCLTGKCSDLKRIGCKKSREGSLRNVTYTVNSKDPINEGKWWCQVGNIKSAAFTLTAPKPPKTTTTKAPVIIKIPVTPAPKPKPTPKPKPKEDTGSIGIKVPEVTVVKPDRKYPDPNPKDGYDVKKSHEPKKDNEGTRRTGTQFWSELTSPHLVIVVLALLGTSLVVNVAFCIRCILVKKYIDKYRRGVSDTSCLERCLCLPKARIRGGYKEDLYEDISSTPRVIYSPGGSAKSSGADREDSTEFQSLARSRAYSPSSHRSQNPAARVGDIYATVVRGPRRQSAAGRYYSPQPPPVSSQRVYDDVPESRSLSDIYARPQRLRPSSAMAGGASSSSATASSCSPRHSPDSAGTPSTIALKRVSEHPVEEELEESERDQEGELIEACTRNNTRLELSKTLLHRADTLLREAGVLLD